MIVCVLITVLIWLIFVAFVLLYYFVVLSLSALMCIILLWHTVIMANKYSYL